MVRRCERRHNRERCDNPLDIGKRHLDRQLVTRRVQSDVGRIGPGSGSSNGLGNKVVKLKVGKHESWQRRRRR